jgi:hypothetical protein
MRHRTRRVALPGSGILVLALALPAMAATPASKTLDEGSSLGARPT